MAISGATKSRADLSLAKAEVINELTELAAIRCPHSPLLRIYWYDGQLGSGRLSADQSDLAYTDHIKLRLGIINGAGEQKEVDSLIVTDMIELARNRAISDAILLAGDGDLRIGVVIAQGLGVRVHLLGISGNQNSQAPQLLQEADTTSKWDHSVIAKFLTLKRPQTVSSALPVASALITLPLSSENFGPVFDKLIATIDESSIAGLYQYWQKQTGIPPEIDGKLLARCREKLGRDLGPDEKRTLRKLFSERLKTTRPKH